MIFSDAAYLNLLTDANKLTIITTGGDTSSLAPEMVAMGLAWAQGNLAKVQAAANQYLSTHPQLSGV